MRITVAIGMMIKWTATNKGEYIMPDTTEPTQSADTVTTEKHVSLAKEIEAFAAEVGADIDEAFHAFKEFVRSKISPIAEAG